VNDLHHGLANAVMIDHVMKFNAEAVPEKMAELARVCGAGSTPHHVGALAHELLARHHFGHDEARSEPVCEPAKREVGHARHGGEEYSVRHGKTADLGGGSSEHTYGDLPRIAYGLGNMRRCP